MIVYLARDIPAFVMYCVYGASRSSLLIESTDSMIECTLLNPLQGWNIHSNVLTMSKTAESDDCLTNQITTAVLLRQQTHQSVGGGGEGGGGGRGRAEGGGG